MLLCLLQPVCFLICIFYIVERVLLLFCFISVSFKTLLRKIAFYVKVVR